MTQRSRTYRPPDCEAIIITPTETVELVCAEMNSTWPYVFDLTASGGWDEMTAGLTRYTIETIPGLEAGLLDHCGCVWEEELMFVGIDDPNVAFEFRMRWM